MVKPKLLQQHHTREFFGHHMLLHASELQLQAANQSEEGQFNRCLAAMTMTSLAVDALVNAVGSRIVDDWSSFERLNPLKKLEQIQHALGFLYEPTESPWANLRDLARFRNDIAHVKPQVIEETKRFAESGADKFLLHMPLSKLERQITPRNAARFLKAVHELKGILAAALPAELRRGIRADTWSSSTTTEQP